MDQKAKYNSSMLRERRAIILNIVNLGGDYELENFD